MLLSIIIPVHNVEAYVGKTLESVFETTAPVGDFEVIVVNDGTQDGSMDVVRRYADRPNLIIVEQENQCLRAARMTGLARAKGEYVWFVDSDDYLVEDGVGKVMKLLDERPGAEVLMFPLMWVYEDAEKNHPDYQVDKEEIVCGKDMFRGLELPIGSVQHFVFQRSFTVLPDVFFPKGLIHEDEYFCPVLIYLAKNVFILEKPVYNYVSRSGSIMASLTIRSSYDLVKIHKLLMRFMGQNVDPDDRSSFRSFCFQRLALCRTRNSQYVDSGDLNRFALAQGSYVWNQWRAVHPQRSLKNKLGRLFYFTMPGVRKRLIGK